MRIFVGLGNPGAEYANTRHNIGFDAIDCIVDAVAKTQTWKDKFDSDYIELRYAGEKIVFIKPRTFMNESGRSVGQWVNYYDVSADDVYVFYDDMDIPFNKLKLKTGGSAGGHNGIRSLIAHLGTEQFHRIRLGIGRPPGALMVHYVLGKFTKAERQALAEGVFVQVVSLFEQLFTVSFKDLMSTYNQKERKK